MEELKLDYIGEYITKRFSQPNMTDLIAEYGSDAISVYFLLENELYLHPQAKIPFNGTISRLISGKLFLPVESVNAVLNRMLELEMLINEDDKFLYMKSILHRRYKSTQISKKRSEASLKRKNIKK